MPEINNPHDHFVRDLLSRAEVAADFLQNYLPPEIVVELDLTRVTLLKDSFVDEALREHLSDLLYQVGLKRGGEAFLYVLLEHKSDPEKWVCMQLLRYLLRIWEAAISDNSTHLPVVIPIVLYHGRKRWRVSERFHSLFAPSELALAREYVPDFEYYLCDLNRFRDEELRGGAELRAGLTLLKHIFDKHLGKHLKPVFRWIIQLPERRRRDYFQTVLIYLWNIGKRLSAAEVRSTLQEIAEEEQGETMPKFESWTDFLDKEFFKREQKGMQQGMQQGMANSALLMLQKRFGILEAEWQTRIRALPPPQLEQLSEALLDFSKREDIFAWLAAHGSEPPIPS